MNISQILSAILLSSISLMSNAALFSTAGVENGSSSFSVEVDGITMTIDSPLPYTLINFPDGVDALDFGDGRFCCGDEHILLSFNVTFSNTVLVTGYNIPATIFQTEFSVSGPGVYATGDTSSIGERDFVNGPLTFAAGQSYNFQIEGGDIFPFGGLYASAVPIPAAAWLFGSALIGLAGIRRNQRKN